MYLHRSGRVRLGRVDVVILERESAVQDLTGLYPSNCGDYVVSAMEHLKGVFGASGIELSITYGIVVDWEAEEYLEWTDDTVRYVEVSSGVQTDSAIVSDALDEHQSNWTRWYEGDIYQMEANNDDE